MRGQLEDNNEKNDKDNVVGKKAVQTPFSRELQLDLMSLGVNKPAKDENVQNALELLRQKRGPLQKLEVVQASDSQLEQSKNERIAKCENEFITHFRCEDFWFALNGKAYNGRDFWKAVPIGTLFEYAKDGLRTDTFKMLEKEKKLNSLVRRVPDKCKDKDNYAEFILMRLIAVHDVAEETNEWGEKGWAQCTFELCPTSDVQRVSITLNVLVECAFHRLIVSQLAPADLSRGSRLRFLPYKPPRRSSDLFNSGNANNKASRKQLEQLAQGISKKQVSSTPFTDIITENEVKGFVIKSRWGDVAHKYGCACRACNLQRSKLNQLEEGDPFSLLKTTTKDGRNNNSALFTTKKRKKVLNDDDLKFTPLLLQKKQKSKKSTRAKRSSPLLIASSGDAQIMIEEDEENHKKNSITKSKQQKSEDSADTHGFGNRIQAPCLSVRKDGKDSPFAVRTPAYTMQLPGKNNNRKEDWKDISSAHPQKESAELSKSSLSSRDKLSVDNSSEDEEEEIEEEEEEIIETEDEKDDDERLKKELKRDIDIDSLQNEALCGRGAIRILPLQQVQYGWDGTFLQDGTPTPFRPFEKKPFIASRAIMVTDSRKAEVITHNKQKDCEVEKESAKPFHNKPKGRNAVGAVTEKPVIRQVLSQQQKILPLSAPVSLNNTDAIQKTFFRRDGLAAAAETLLLLNPKEEEDKKKNRKQKQKKLVRNSDDDNKLRIESPGGDDDFSAILLFEQRKKSLIEKARLAFKIHNENLLLADKLRSLGFSCSMKNGQGNFLKSMIDIENVMRAHLDFYRVNLLWRRRLQELRCDQNERLNVYHYVLKRARKEVWLDKEFRIFDSYVRYGDDHWALIGSKQVESDADILSWNAYKSVRNFPEALFEMKVLRALVMEVEGKRDEENPPPLSYAPELYGFIRYAYNVSVLRFIDPRRTIVLL